MKILLLILMQISAGISESFTFAKEPAKEPLIFKLDPQYISGFSFTKGPDKHLFTIHKAPQAERVLPASTPSNLKTAQQPELLKRSNAKRIQPHETPEMLRSLHLPQDSKPVTPLINTKPTSISNPYSALNRQPLQIPKLSNIAGNAQSSKIGKPSSIVKSTQPIQTINPYNIVNRMQGLQTPISSNSDVVRTAQPTYNYNAARNSWPQQTSVPLNSYAQPANSPVTRNKLLSLNSVPSNLYNIRSTLNQQGIVTNKHGVASVPNQYRIKGNIKYNQHPETNPKLLANYLPSSFGQFSTISPTYQATPADALFFKQPERIKLPSKNPQKSRYQQLLDVTTYAPPKPNSKINLNTFIEQYEDNMSQNKQILQHLYTLKNKYKLNNDDENKSKHNLMLEQLHLLNNDDDDDDDNDKNQSQGDLILEQLKLLREYQQNKDDKQSQKDLILQQLQLFQNKYPLDNDNDDDNQSEEDDIFEQLKLLQNKYQLNENDDDANGDENQSEEDPFLEKLKQLQNKYRYHLNDDDDNGNGDDNQSEEDPFLEKLKQLQNKYRYHLNDDDDGNGDDSQSEDPFLEKLKQLQNKYWYYLNDDDDDDDESQKPRILRKLLSFQNKYQLDDDGNLSQEESILDQLKQLQNKYQVNDDDNDDDSQSQKDTNSEQLRQFFDNKYKPNNDNQSKKDIILEQLKKLQNKNNNKSQKYTGLKPTRTLFLQENVNSQADEENIAVRPIFYPQPITESYEEFPNFNGRIEKSEKNNPLYISDSGKINIAEKTTVDEDSNLASVYLPYASSIKTNAEFKSTSNPDPEKQLEPVSRDVAKLLKERQLMLKQYQLQNEYFQKELEKTKKAQQKIIEQQTKKQNQLQNLLREREGLVKQYEHQNHAYHRQLQTRSVTQPFDQMFGPMQPLYLYE